MTYPSLLELITAAQLREKWSDAELDRHLGLRDASLMALVREGAVDLSYSTVLNIESHLDVNPLQMLQSFLSHQGASTERAVLAMYELLKVKEETRRIEVAYGAACDGDTRVSSLRLPHATVWVVPHATMKPEEAAGHAD
jgi:hypothetical protein